MIRPTLHALMLVLAVCATPRAETPADDVPRFEGRESYLSDPATVGSEPVVAPRRFVVTHDYAISGATEPGGFAPEVGSSKIEGQLTIERSEGDRIVTVTETDWSDEWVAGLPRRGEGSVSRTQIWIGDDGAISRGRYGNADGWRMDWPVHQGVAEYPLIPSLHLVVGSVPAHPAVEVWQGDLVIFPLHSWADPYSLEGAMAGRASSVTRRDGELALVLDMWAPMEVGFPHTSGFIPLSGYGVLELRTGLLVELELKGRSEPMGGWGGGAVLDMHVSYRLDPPVEPGP